MCASSFGSGRNRWELLRDFHLDGRQWPDQSQGKDVVHGVDEVKLHLAAQILWILRQVLLIFFRKDRFEDSCAMSREQLLFQSANRKHLSTRSDLTRHGQVAPNGNLAQRT